jgi:hypothetical protein
VSKAVEVGNNFVVHQADQVVAKKAKTLQDRIVISLNVVYNFIYIIKPLIIYLVAVFFLSLSSNYYFSWMLFLF